MSWILNPEGDRPTAKKDENQTTSSTGPSSSAANTSTPNETRRKAAQRTDDDDDDAAPKVQDPSDPTRFVSAKRANRPFLVHQEYRKKMQAEHDAWAERQKVRAEKIAKGEDVGPEEPDPTAEPEIGCIGILKFLFYTLVVFVLAGKFLTGSFVWEQELPNIRKWLPTNERLFSEQGLAQFDGTVEGRPIYLAIDGEVYDVTEGKATYGPGGSYHSMAGVDAARAFGTGCFATHRTHDTRGMDEDELRGLNHWKEFYAKSNKYHRVGRVSHPPIDPMSPIPEHCQPKKAKAQKVRAAKAKANAKAESDTPPDTHAEL